MSTKLCKNCGKSLHGLYCSHCGQKAKAERITFLYLWHEVFHFFTHIESVFLSTSVKLLSEPGKTVCDFIAGRRKTYQSPVSYFLIWITIYILSLYLVNIAFGENMVISYGEYFGPAATTKYAISHLSLVLAVVVPFQALYLFLLVNNRRFNYYEMLVAAIYAIGTIIQLQFIFVMVSLVYHLISGAAVDLRISDALKAGYLSWFAFKFIKLIPVNAKFIRVLLFIVLAFGTFTMWRLYGVPQFIDWISKPHS